LESYVQFGWPQRRSIIAAIGLLGFTCTQLHQLTFHSTLFNNWSLWALGSFVFTFGMCLVLGLSSVLNGILIYRLRQNPRLTSRCGLIWVIRDIYLLFMGSKFSTFLLLVLAFIFAKVYVARNMDRAVAICMKYIIVTAHVVSALWFLLSNFALHLTFLSIFSSCLSVYLVQQNSTDPFVIKLKALMQKFWPEGIYLFVAYGLAFYLISNYWTETDGQSMTILVLLLCLSSRLTLTLVKFGSTQYRTTASIESDSRFDFAALAIDIGFLVFFSARLCYNFYSNPLLTTILLPVNDNLCFLIGAGAEAKLHWRKIGSKKRGMELANSLADATEEEIQRQADDVCPVCHDAMVTAKINTCGHAFHLLCVTRLLSNSVNNCPLCQQEFKSPQ